MKKVIRLLISLLLFSMTVISCTVPENKKQEQSSIEQYQEDIVAQEEIKGRYREEKIDLPASISKIFDVNSQEDGHIQILFENDPGSFYLYESKDFGISWQQKELETDWLLEENRVAFACFGEQGTIIAVVGKMSEDPMKLQHPIGKYSYFKMKPTEEGWQTDQITIDLPQPKEEELEEGYGLTQIDVSTDGNLYGILQSGTEELMSYQLYCCDLNNGSVTWNREIKPAKMALFGNKIYLEEHEEAIQTIDAKSGKKLSDLEISTHYPACMDVNLKNNTLFYCDESGIYGTDEKGALTELLVDGELSSLSNYIDYYIDNFCYVNENIFLAFMGNYASSQIELFRYEYDAELPTYPQKELVVYSLKKNNIIQKLVSDFKLKYPDILVKYEIGMEESNAEMESDIMDQLNTEIMAGNGPDILLLNNLPWKSYQEKEILLDLSSDLESDLEEGKVFENIFTAFQKDNCQYVIPISFKIPVLLQKQAQKSEVSSVEDLLKTVQNTEEMPLMYRNGQDLLRYIISVYWQKIQKEEGMIDQDELKLILQQTKSINDELRSKAGWAWDFYFQDQENTEIDLDAFLYDTELMESDIQYGNIAMDLGYLSSLRTLIHIPNFNQEYQIVSNHVFSPLLVGINSKAEHVDTAKEFIKFALSEEEQQIFTGKIISISGLPVNQDVFQSMVKEPSEDEIQEQYKKTFDNLGIPFSWPKQELFDKLKQEITNLSVPAMEDPIVIQTILESGMPYLSEKKKLDDTVDEIVQKLRLYFAE